MEPAVSIFMSARNVPKNLWLLIPKTAAIAAVIALAGAKPDFFTRRMILMKTLVCLVLLLSLISSCIVYEGIKVERTEAELNKKETNLQDEIDRVQGDVDRLERENEAQKKKLVREGD